jgi:hypothetical protein
MIGDRRRPSIPADALFEITRQRIAELQTEACRDRNGWCPQNRDDK